MRAVPFVLGTIAVAAAAIAAWLARPIRLDPVRRAELAAAVGAVDRELAANLELVAMFDQTKHPVVLENAEFARHRPILDRDAGGVALAVAGIYERIPEAEGAMSRRGPANSIKAEDRELIDGWEGDVRDVQRSLRATLHARPTWGLRAAMARLGGSSVSR